MPETRLKETQPPMSGCFFVVCEPKTLNLTKKGALLPTYLVVLQHSLLMGFEFLDVFCQILEDICCFNEALLLFQTKR